MPDVDATLPLETRLATARALLALLIENVLKADREKDTGKAGEDLRAGAKKILRHARCKEEVMRLLSWPVFTPREAKPRAAPTVQAQYAAPQPTVQYAAPAQYPASYSPAPYNQAPAGFNPTPYDRTRAGPCGDLRGSRVPKPAYTASASAAVSGVREVGPRGEDVLQEAPELRPPRAAPGS